LRDNPSVSVEVRVNDKPVDLVGEGFDAGIRFGDTVERDMVAVRVGPDIRLVVVGTPEYLERHSRPETPAELEGHDCINYRLAGSGGLLVWDFEGDGREIRLRTPGRLIVDDESMHGAAVRAGAGLGLMMEADVADDIAAGRLIQVLDSWCGPFSGCHLFYPNRQVTPALRALIGALRWSSDRLD
jgi:DNA-binding transcriptional LysR family regulator